MSTFSYLKSITRHGAAALVVLAVPLSASAHYLWLQPSQFDVGSNEQWITADAAISKAAFHYDALPMPLEGLAITAPDGSVVQALNPQVRAHRSLFDFKLEKDGVYRVALHDHALFAMYKVDGQVKRWHGTAQAFKSLLPANAQEVRVSETDTRLEAFVVRNQPGAQAPKPLGKGLEIVPQAPLDSFKRGASSAFVVLMDGKPLSDLKVSVVSNDENQAEDAPKVEIMTAADGTFVAHWHSAGSYLLTAQTADEHTTLKPATQRRLTYGLTVAVRRG